MKIKLLTLCFFTGALLAPVAGYSADTPKKDTAPPKETVVEKIDDAAITAHIKADMALEKDVSATSIKVETTKGVVRLTGTAKSKEEADKAAAVANRTKGVTTVQNDIKVQPTSTSSSMKSDSTAKRGPKDTKEIVADSVITTEVKADFVKDKQVDASAIKVKTTKGVVHLSGTAKSQAEADKAVEIARGIKGVSSVQSNLKVKSKS